MKPPEEKTAQVVLKNRRYICADVPFGAPVFVTPTLARQLVAQGVVEIVGGGRMMPVFSKPAGPTEGKIIGTVARARDEKKADALSESQASPSIDSASSDDPGAAKPSASSVAVPASATSKPAQSKPRGRPKKSG